LRTASEEADAHKAGADLARQQAEAKCGENRRAVDEALSVRKSRYWSERCDNAEAQLRGCYEQISGLQANIDKLTQERNGFQNSFAQKDIEISQLRGDLTGALEKSQVDLRAKDGDLAELRARMKVIARPRRSTSRFNAELKIDNETKASQLRYHER